MKSKTDNLFLINAMTVFMFSIEVAQIRKQNHE